MRPFLSFFLEHLSNACFDVAHDFFFSVAFAEVSFNGFEVIFELGVGLVIYCEDDSG